jgi:hypothetical protein
LPWIDFAAEFFLHAGVDLFDSFTYLVAAQEILALSPDFMFHSSLLASSPALSGETDFNFFTQVHRRGLLASCSACFGFSECTGASPIFFRLLLVSLGLHDFWVYAERRSWFSLRQQVARRSLHEPSYRSPVRRHVPISFLTAKFRSPGLHLTPWASVMSSAFHSSQREQHAGWPWFPTSRSRFHAQNFRVPGPFPTVSSFCRRDLVSAGRFLPWSSFSFKSDPISLFLFVAAALQVCSCCDLDCCWWKPVLSWAAGLKGLSFL